MISNDRLDFLNSCFLLDIKGINQSLQSSVNQIINPLGTSQKASKLPVIDGFEAFSF